MKSRSLLAQALAEQRDNVRRIRSQTDPIALDGFCEGARRVIITIEPVIEECSADAQGASMHVEFRASVGEDNTHITNKFQKAKNERGPITKVWRSGPGSYCVRPGVSMALVGGVGLWSVEVVKGIESFNEPGDFYLDRAVNTEETASHYWIPPGHQKLHCIAGVLIVGGYVVMPGQWVCAALASRLGWTARGIVRTSCEV